MTLMWQVQKMSFDTKSFWKLNTIRIHWIFQEWYSDSKKQIHVPYADAFNWWHLFVKFQLSSTWVFFSLRDLPCWAEIPILHEQNSALKRYRITVSVCYAKNGLQKAENINMGIGVYQYGHYWSAMNGLLAVWFKSTGYVRADGGSVCVYRRPRQRTGCNSSNRINHKANTRTSVLPGMTHSTDFGIGAMNCEGAIKN
jgi:hypothetical protein